MKKDCKFCGRGFETNSRARTLCDTHTQGRPPEERFWAKVNRRAENGCWEWTASRDGRGYGQVNIKGMKRAHRVAWELIKGKIPPGKFICHHCDNKVCVNPDHLFIGDALKNTQDMDRKGRRVNTPSYGEKHGMAKLTNQKVRIIKTLLKGKRMNGRKIARYFGVCFATIGHIKTGRQWKGVSI